MLFIHLVVLSVILANLEPENKSNLYRGATALIALATIRLLFAFEKRPFSHIHAEGTFFGGLSIVCISSDWLNSSLTLLSVVACVVSLVVSLSRENAALTMKREADAQSFLSHALKQSLEALEVQLRACYLRWQGSLMYNVLECALAEAREGHYACHAANIVQSLSQGTYVAMASDNCLKRTLRDWSDDGSLASLEHIVLDSDDHGESIVHLDWEMLRLLLIGWSKGGKRLSISSTTQPHESLVNFRFELAALVTGEIPKKVSHKRVLESLASALGGEFETPTVFLLRLPLISRAVTTPRTSVDLRRSLKTPSQAHAFPVELSFAILDDNLLVRRSSERIATERLFWLSYPS